MIYFLYRCFPTKKSKDMDLILIGSFRVGRIGEFYRQALNAWVLHTTHLKAARRVISVLWIRYHAAFFPGLHGVTECHYWIAGYLMIVNTTVHAAHMSAFDSGFIKEKYIQRRCACLMLCLRAFYVVLLSNNDSTYSAKALGLCIY